MIISCDSSISFRADTASVPPDAEPVDSAHRLPPSTEVRAELLGIVLRAQSGDLDAQSDLVRLYTKRISAFVRAMLYQPQAAEDITQIVFIKMARRIALLRDPVTFEPWLFTLARNTTIDYLRQLRVRPVTIGDETDLVHLADPTAAHTLPEIMEALEVALRRLSPRNQSLVRMVVQGFSYRAIAEREGLTIGAVKLRMNRVRPFLRASIRGDIGRPAPTLRFRPLGRGRAAA